MEGVIDGVVVVDGRVKRVGGLSVLGGRVGGGEIAIAGGGIGFGRRY